MVVLVDEDKSRWRRRDRAPVARVAAVFSDVGESSAPDSDLEETLPHSDVSSMLEEEEEEEEQIAMDRHIPRETFFTPSKLAQLQVGSVASPNSSYFCNSACPLWLLL